MLCACPISLPVFAANFAGGTGTIENPYLISTKEHLDNVRKNLNAHYKLINDIEFSIDDFESTGTFYNDGDGWIPIGGGKKTTPFTGTFDGNGYTISGIQISLEEYPGLYIVYTGLFGYNKGTICNLNLTECNFSTIVYTEADYSISNYIYSGYVTGYNENVIKNCTITNSELICKHTYTADNSYRIYVGGIAGYSSGYIGDCTNVGSVKTASSFKNSYTLDTGGIVGYNTGKIFNCFNKNKVESIFEAESVHSSVGGIAGMSENGVIVQCHNSGSLVANSKITSGDFSVNATNGGIVGMSTKTVIENCYNTGTVSSTATASRTSASSGASSTAYCYAGGIVGTMNSEYSSIRNCYNTALVYGNAYAYGAYARAQVYAGGIAGSSYGKIETCFNLGSVAKTATSTVNPVSLCGGIVAMNSTKGTIADCYYIDSIEIGIGSGKGQTVSYSKNLFKEKESFSNFDFKNVWKLDAEYPQLQTKTLHHAIGESNNGMKNVYVFVDDAEFEYADVLVAVYSKDCSLLDCVVTSKEDYLNCIQISVDDNTSYIKILLWNTLSNMNPLVTYNSIQIE